MNDLKDYVCEEYVRPFWKGDTVLGESAFVLENALGELRPIRLAFPIRKVISVRSGDLRTTYREGIDYRVNAYGELEIVREGSIPRRFWSDYRCPEFDASRDDRMASADALGAWRTGDLFSDREGMRAWQIAVSYTHTESDIYDVTQGKSEKFPRLLQLLGEKRPVRVVSYGDSITYGWAASGMQDIRKPPYCMPYAQMIADALSARFGAPIEHVNCSVSGKCTDWAELDENIAGVIAAKPDLVILAFGMNDGGSTALAQTMYMRRVIDAINARLPDTEVALVSTMLPNDEVAGFWGNQYTFEEKYLENITVNCPQAAIVRMTTMHSQLLESKEYYHMTGNNVNHPNDFLIRMYAMNLTATLVEY